MWTTAGMAALGYFAIVGALAASLTGVFYLLTRLSRGEVKLIGILAGLGLVSLAWSLARALWSRHTPPSGIPVRRKDAPALFDMIDSLRKRTGAPRVDRVLIDGAMNAAVVQQPRLGLLGWYRNHLVLGLPLMMGLGVKPFAAVVAHEFGHLAGGHGKIAGWVYRTRRSWLELAAARARPRAGGVWLADAALTLFFSYFFPRFDARAFVLSRQQEYEADGVAQAIVGQRASTEGLISINLHGRHLSEDFWPGVYSACAEQATPEASPYAAMGLHLNRTVAHPRAALWLRQSLERLPAPDDTHPSLRDRLAFANTQAVLPAPHRRSAAEQLLAGSLAGLIEQMDATWRAEVKQAWAARHRELKAQTQSLRELRAARAEGPIEPWDHLLWSSAARQLEGAAASEAVLRQLRVDHPDFVPATHALGCLLLDTGDAVFAAEGADMLRSVAERGLTEFAQSAAERYEDWLMSTSRHADLKSWRERRRNLLKQAADVEEALQDFAGPQRIGPTGLSKRILRPVLDVLMREPAVGRAFLVRKTVNQASNWNFAMLVLERSRATVQPDAEEWWADMRGRCELPWPFMVVDLAHPFWKEDEQRPLVRQILELSGACIYSGRTL